MKFDNKSLWPLVRDVYARAYENQPTNYADLFGPITPPTRWQRIKYQFKRPFWWLRDWLCRALGCE